MCDTWISPLIGLAWVWIMGSHTLRMGGTNQQACSLNVGVGGKKGSLIIASYLSRQELFLLCHAVRPWNQLTIDQTSTDCELKSSLLCLTCGCQAFILSKEKVVKTLGLKRTCLRVFPQSTPFERTRFEITTRNGNIVTKCIKFNPIAGPQFSCPQSAQVSNSAYVS